MSRYRQKRTGDPRKAADLYTRIGRMNSDRTDVVQMGKMFHVSADAFAKLQKYAAPKVPAELAPPMTLGRMAGLPVVVSPWLPLYKPVSYQERRRRRWAEKRARRSAPSPLAAAARAPGQEGTS